MFYSHCIADSNVVEVTRKNTYWNAVQETHSQFKRLNEEANDSKASRSPGAIANDWTFTLNESKTRSTTTISQISISLARRRAKTIRLWRRSAEKNISPPPPELRRLNFTHARRFIYTSNVSIISFLCRESRITGYELARSPIQTICRTFPYPFSARG